MADSRVASARATQEKIMTPPTIIASDLEGVLVPEIWIAVAEKTGIAALRRTTRDEPDYDLLMHQRMDILREHGLTLHDIQQVIATLDPLPGAAEFLAWARSQAQVIILSDTFYEFALPLTAKLGSPTLFCHTLNVDDAGMIAGYTLRQPDSKRQAVKAFQSLRFRVIAMGDSYNDVSMLSVANHGILFCPPANVVAEFPQFPAMYEYAELRQQIESIIAVR
jgi:phosphoserine/homoserine phosphotransferase